MQDKGNEEEDGQPDERQGEKDGNQDQERQERENTSRTTSLTQGPGLPVHATRILALIPVTGNSALEIAASSSGLIEITSRLSPERGQDYSLIRRASKTPPA